MAQHNELGNRGEDAAVNYLKEKGYQRIRTKSMNRFKPMMILNLKNGFDIVQVYTNDSGQTKIVFEKDLI